MDERQRRERIKELRAELRTLSATPPSDWHAAFQAILLLKTHDFPGITMNAEVEIGMDPPRADFLILREDEHVDLLEDPFKIFRRINVIEYKRPDDRLNRRVLHKAAGYAHMLIGTARREADVPEDQVSVSVFRQAKNDQMFRSMLSTGELEETDMPGVYHVRGFSNLPFQIVITSELEGRGNAAFRAMGRRASREDVLDVMRDYKSESDATLQESYRVLLSLIGDKNPGLLDELKKEDDAAMSTVLLEVMRDEIEDLKEEACRKTRREEKVRDIRSVMSSFGVGVERAMDALDVPAGEREEFAALVRGEG